MLIRDSEQQIREAAGDSRRLAAHTAKQKLVEDLANQCEPEEWADMERQTGRPMSHDQLENTIRNLSPYKDNLRFLDHPWMPEKRVAYVLEPGGNLQYISAYNRGMIPEFCKMQEAYEYVPDPDLPTTKDGIPLINADVLTKTPEKPGFIKRRVKGEEEIRSWRSVLVRFVTYGLIEAETVLRLFQSNSAGWNFHLKRNAANPLIASYV